MGSVFSVSIRAPVRGRYNIGTLWNRYKSFNPRPREGAMPGQAPAKCSLQFQSAPP